ncbi:biosynthetic arginine decarboxylase [soil metagenome]
MPELASARPLGSSVPPPADPARQASPTTYGIDKWGAGYFSVSQAGEICAHLIGADGSEDDVSLFGIVRTLEASGIGTPILLRFPSILESRINRLNEGFAAAIAEGGYTGRYRGVFPIKVNQQEQVIREVTAYGRRFHYGLEAGSKPELIAALAYLDDPRALLICNGYKDHDFIDLALRARKMDTDVVLVLEMPQELDIIMERADALGVEPALGIRVKLSSESGGHWVESGGEQSPFGLNIAQLMTVVDRLRKAGKLGWLKMLHCHQGSQIPDLFSIKRATCEAARIYSGLIQEGAPMGMLNLGGGLAVDYDGSRSALSSSANYSMEDYCEALVESVKSVTDDAGVAHPTLITESGRAITAHYAALVVKVMDVNRFTVDGDISRDGCGDLPPIIALEDLSRTVSAHNCLECYDKAFRYRDELRDAFNAGEIGLRDRSVAEQLFWQVLTRVGQFSRDLPAHAVLHEKLRNLDAMLADRYYANFSVFQSTADAWAIGQMFPVSPLHRLHEMPTRVGVLNDVTCDCDGKIKKYITDLGGSETIPLHGLRDGEDYYLAIFLLGAYQETLSDMHNLFGDTHAVSVELEDGKARTSREVYGDRVSDVLSYVEHDPAELEAQFVEKAARAHQQGTLTATEHREVVEAFQRGLKSYTYFAH